MSLREQHPASHQRAHCMSLSCVLYSVRVASRGCVLRGYACSMVVCIEGWVCAVGCEGLSAGPVATTAQRSQGSCVVYHQCVSFLSQLYGLFLCVYHWRVCCQPLLFTFVCVCLLYPILCLYDTVVTTCMCFCLVSAAIADTARAAGGLQVGVPVDCPSAAAAPGRL